MSDETNPDSGVSGDLSLDQAASLADSYDEQPEEQQEDDQSVETDQSEDQDHDDSDDQAEEGDEQSDDDSEEIEHDGQKYKIPKALKDSFLKGVDYTHKTQQLAEQRKAIEQHAQALVEERQYYANHLTGLVQGLASQVNQLPSDEQLLELSRTDPNAYLQAKAERDYKLNQLNQAQQAQQLLARQQEIEDQRATAAQLENERNSLLTKLPNWKDEKVAAKERADISGYLSAEGYTADELAGITDHRALLVARKAMLYDQFMAGKGKENKQPPQKQIKSLPAGNKGKAAPKVDQSLVKTFKRSGSIDDALRILNGLG